MLRQVAASRTPCCMCPRDMAESGTAPLFCGLSLGQNRRTHCGDTAHPLCSFFLMPFHLSSCPQGGRLPTQHKNLLRGMVAAFQSSVTVRQLVKALQQGLQAAGRATQTLSVAYAAAQQQLDRWQVARAGDLRLELLHSAQPEGGSEQHAEVALPMLVAAINSRVWTLGNFFTLSRWVAACMSACAVGRQASGQAGRQADRRAGGQAGPVHLNPPHPAICWEHAVLTGGPEPRCPRPAVT